MQQNVEKPSLIKMHPAPYDLSQGGNNLTYSQQGDILI